ncbi:MAG: M23 family metallopeptidase [Anaerolineae bacterium]|nr:M23 family metallopeptidase [Anaerolineae bacterium]
MELQDDFTWRGHPVIHGLARVAAWIWRWHDDQIGLRPLLGRLTSHAALALTLILLVVFGSLQWDMSVRASEASNSALSGGLVQSLSTSSAVLKARPRSRPSSQAQIVRVAQPHTVIPERPRLEILTYVVQPGDTAESIAEIFGILPTTLMWSNPEIEKAPDLLRVGQVLTILPIDGVYHTVEAGDTLESLAETYNVSVESIIACSFNTIAENGDLVVEQKLIVPGGTKPYTTREVTTYEGTTPVDVAGSGYFRWPASGVLTQGYWYGHRAIDIGSDVGTAIFAADDGYVSFAGWTDIGYGYLVVVDHANGYKTYYAHLSNIFVFEGAEVQAGEVIAAMGSTGNSTGPHLHFEIRYDGYPTNPLIYLP